MIDFHLKSFFENFVKVSVEKWLYMKVSFYRNFVYLELPVTGKQTDLNFAAYRKKHNVGLKRLIAAKCNDG